MSGFLPLIHRGDRIRALVVGGGEVAHRKVQDLLVAGAEVRAVSTTWDDRLRLLLQSRNIPHETRAFQPGDTQGFSLVIVATDDAELNRLVSDEAATRGIPVNVVDQPEQCSVYFPAVVRDDHLLLAVSTGGTAPFLAREIRKALDSWLEDEGWSLRAKWAGKFRSYVNTAIKQQTIRDSLFERFMNEDPAALAAWRDENPPFALWESWVKEVAR